MAGVDTLEAPAAARVLHQPVRLRERLETALPRLAAEGRRWPVIAADPAWLFHSWSHRGEGRGASQHYTTMELREMARLPVGALAARDARIYVWTTGPHLFQTKVLLRAWGFAYSRLAFVWIKTKPTTRLDKGWVCETELAKGLGYGPRGNAELVLEATRGSPSYRKPKADIDQVVFAPRGRHSEKPEEVQQRIEALCEGPYLEIFARSIRPGWSAIGDQLQANLLSGLEAAE